MDGVETGFKKTEVGVIPSDWDVCSLKEILSGTRLGGNYPNSEVKTEYPLMKMGNIQRSVISLDKVEYVSTVKPKEEDQLSYGDVLFNTRNTLDLVGKVAIWRNELPKAYYNSNLLKFSFDPSYISSSFFFNYLINTKKNIDQLRSIATGTTSVAAIYTRDLLEIKVAVPPLQEQKAIATALSDVDALIQKLDELIEKKQNIKKATMQLLLTGKKRLDGFDGEWEEVRLGEVSSISTGAKDNKDKIDDGKYPFFVRSEEIERIDTYSYDGKAIVIPGDGRIGSIFHFIDGKFEAHQRVYIINSFRKMHAKFIYYNLSENFKEHALKYTSKATVDSLRMPVLKNFKLFRPTNFEEQKAIAKIIEDMDREIDALNDKKDKYLKIKMGMMQQLLTGKTRLI